MVLNFSAWSSAIFSLIDSNKLPLSSLRKILISIDFCATFYQVVQLSGPFVFLLARCIFTTQNIIYRYIGLSVYYYNFYSSLLFIG